MLLLLTACLYARAEAEQEKVVGWVEKVRILPGDVVLQAKLNTGVDNSALHAKDIAEFSREGKKWVRFNIEDRYGNSTVLERPIATIAKIKTAGNKVRRRPVIRLQMCLGTSHMETDVTLHDRTRYEYPLLLGRRFLAGVVLVNPARMFTVEPECKERTKP